LPESGDNPVEFHHNGSTWHRFFPPPDIDDSLVPTHVAVNGYKLRSTVRQLNPVSASSTHPRVSRDDVLGIFMPWLRDPISAGNLLRWAQRDYFAAEKLITAARLLVEALIDGRLSEDDLRAAEQEWEQGNRELDRAILSRITISGVDTEGAPPLFTDLNALYATI
jgi:type I restriction enzyme, S subunit